jgi:hypothetical protein
MLRAPYAKSAAPFLPGDERALLRSDSATTWKHPSPLPTIPDFPQMSPAAARAPTDVAKKRFFDIIVGVYTEDIMPANASPVKSNISQIPQGRFVIDAVTISRQTSRLGNKR